MTDRELLERAAKAAGIVALEYGPDQFPEDEEGGIAGFFLFYDTINSEHLRDWNPLTDDGDALRLAVKLRINIDHDSNYADPCKWVSANFKRQEIDNESERQEATRRAIVRAAAATAEGGAK